MSKTLAAACTTPVCLLCSVETGTVWEVTTGGLLLELLGEPLVTVVEFGAELGPGFFLIRCPQKMIVHTTTVES